MDFDEELTRIMAMAPSELGSKIAKCEDLMSEFISKRTGTDEESSVFERMLNYLLSLYVESKDGSHFQNLLTVIKEFLTSIPKARTAKFVNLIIKSLKLIPDTLELQESICDEWVKWSKNQDLAQVRQRLETELAQIYLERGKCREAIGLLSSLTQELRKIDHKSQLVEVHLIESKTYRALDDYSRAKAALTAARTNAAAVYIPPLLQGDLDLESGIIFIEESEYRTANSYLMEAFEAFDSSKSPLASCALRYGLLSKILNGHPEECYSTVTGVKRQGIIDRGIEGMLSIAKAAEAKSLQQLFSAIDKYNDIIESDPVVRNSLNRLTQDLQEQHLLRVVTPYSSIELSHICELIELPIDMVQNTVTQMILDGKLHGSINQHDGILNITDPEEMSNFAKDSETLIEKLDTVVDALYSRCKLLN